MSQTNVARAGKRENICVGNNVSATMCPRLPGPLGDRFKAQEVENKCVCALRVPFLAPGFHSPESEQIRLRKCRY